MAYYLGRGSVSEQCQAVLVGLFIQLAQTGGTWTSLHCVEQSCVVSSAMLGFVVFSCHSVQWP